LFNFFKQISLIFLKCLVFYIAVKFRTSLVQFKICEHNLGKSYFLCLIYIIVLSADLKTMSKRVESELYYVTFEMFVADVRRMFANARTYNSPETIYYKCATRHVLELSSTSWFTLFFLWCFLHLWFWMQVRIPLSKQSTSGSSVWLKNSVGISMETVGALQ